MRLSWARWGAHSVTARGPAKEKVLICAATSGGEIVWRLRKLSRNGGINGAEGARLIGDISPEDSVDIDPLKALEIGRTCARLGDTMGAVRHFQIAATAPELRTQALRGAGDAFSAAGLPAASDACYRRAAYSEPTDDEKRILYDQGCAAQRNGALTDATAYFEMLLSWDVDYLDAWSRWRACRRSETAVPRTAAGAGRTDAAVDALALRQLLPSHRPRLDAYDTSLYSRYEHCPPQDTVKKSLEMVNLVAAIDLSGVGTALDVGTATFRYPRSWERFGIRSAGIDISDEGVRGRYEGGDRMRFAVADASKLPFRADMFDLVTCMMGTLNHMYPRNRERFVAEALRVVRPGGHLAVSCWDPECAFQTFLSMYSPRESLELRSRLVSRAELRDEMTRAGFVDVRAVSFCFFPDWVAADLSSSSADATVLARLARLDAAVRARWPRRAGQMFLLIGRRDGEVRR